MKDSIENLIKNKNKYKSMKNSKKIEFLFFLLITLTSFSLVSSSQLSCVLDDNVTNLTVYLGDHNSYANFYFNSFGHPECDEINLTKLLEEYNIGWGDNFNLSNIGIFGEHLKNNLKINLSNVLISYDFGFVFGEKENRIHFNNLDISNNLLVIGNNDYAIGARALITNVFSYLYSQGKIKENYTAEQLTSNPSLLDEIVNENLIDQYDFPKMWGDLSFLKQGTIYQFNYSKGLGDLNETYLNRMKDAVKNKEYWELNVNKFVKDSVLSIFDFSILGNSFGNLTVNVTTGNLEVKNGSYIIPIIFNYDGEKQIKNISLIIYSSAYSEKEDEGEGDEDDLNEGEQLANKPTTIINETTNKVIFNNESLVLNTLIIPKEVDSSKQITLDMSKVIIPGTPEITKVVVPKEISLIRETDVVNYSVSIPKDISIIGPSSWDGTLILPTLTTTTTSLGKVDKVIEVGSLSLGLIFNKPVKITIGGMAGKYAFFQNDSGSYSIKKCDSTANENSAGGLTSDECYLDNGNDLIIWTYHFTKFGAYEPLITTRRHKRVNNTVISNEETGINENENPLVNPNSNGIINLNKPSPTNVQKNNKGFFGITGGAIANLFGGNGEGFFILTLVLLIIGVSILLIMLSKRKKSQKNKNEKNENIEEEKIEKDNQENEKDLNKKEEKTKNKKKDKKK
jgi:hypothetical protein